RVRTIRPEVGPSPAAHSLDGPPLSQRERELDPRNSRDFCERAAGSSCGGAAAQVGECYVTGTGNPPWRADSVAARATLSAARPSWPVGVAGVPAWTAATKLANS